MQRYQTSKCQLVGWYFGSWWPIIPFILLREKVSTRQKNYLFQANRVHCNEKQKVTHRTRTVVYRLVFSL